MRVKLQLVICDDDGQEETVTDIVTMKKDHRRLEHLGLTLAEAKQLLKIIQQRVLQHQTLPTHPGRICGIKPTHSRWDRLTQKGAIAVEAAASQLHVVVAWDDTR